MSDITTLANEYDITRAALAAHNLNLSDLCGDLERSIRASIRRGEAVSVTTRFGADGLLYGRHPKSSFVCSDGPTITIPASNRP